MKKEKKLAVRLQHHFLCRDCTKAETHTVIFCNSDDNVCIHCGSKNTDELFQAILKAEFEF